MRRFRGAGCVLAGLHALMAWFHADRPNASEYRLRWARRASAESEDRPRGVRDNSGEQSLERALL